MTMTTDLVLGALLRLTKRGEQARTLVAEQLLAGGAERLGWAEDHLVDAFEGEAADLALRRLEHDLAAHADLVAGTSLEQEGGADDVLDFVLAELSAEVTENLVQGRFEVRSSSALMSAAGSLKTEAMRRFARELTSLRAFAAAEAAVEVER